MLSLDTLFDKTEFSENKHNFLLYFNKIRSILWASRVSILTSINTALKQVRPLASSNLTGRWVKKRSKTSSFLIPITESSGPVIPTSLMKAVPQARPGYPLSVHGYEYQLQRSLARPNTIPGHLLRSGFSVNINQNASGSLAILPPPVRRLGTDNQNVWAKTPARTNSPHQHGTSSGDWKRPTAAPWARPRYSGAHYPFLRIYKIKDLLLIPNVIAHCQDISAQRKQLLSHFARQSDPTGRILSIHHANIKPIL